MNLHSGARSCPASRALLIERIQDGCPVMAAAAALGVSRRTAYKWRVRHAREGAVGLQDRSSRPRSTPTALRIEEVCCIVLLRESRMTMAQIATSLEIPRSTVARVLMQRGLSRLKTLDDQTPPRRYTRRHPGELLHLDVKKLGRITGFYGHRITGNRCRRRRGAGWDFVHIAIDDASRLAYAEVLPNEQGDTSAAFLARAVAWFKRKAIRVRRVLTDNGSGYVSACFGLACSQLRVPHLRTRPYRPCTNGKAERFIQTLLREWAYVRPYRTSGLRARALPLFLAYYNNERPHGSLGGRSPISRIRSRREQPPETSHLAAEQRGLSGLGGLSFPDPRLPELWATVTASWQKEVLAAAKNGDLANLSAFPSMVLLDKRRGEDQASKMLAFAESQFGRFEVPPDVTAFQIIMEIRRTTFRSLRKIRGAFISILWVGPDGPRADFLWELLGQERESASHITVIRGTVDREPDSAIYFEQRGSLVFYNLQPSVLRSFSDEQLAKMLNLSLHVRGAHGKLQQARRNGISSADIRSHLFDQIRAGTHPVALASNTVDAMKRTSREGLSGLSHKLVSLEANLSEISDQTDPADSPESVLERDDANEEVRQALEGLDPRSLDMVTRWMAQDETQEQIAAHYGISQERVGQIIRRALAVLRKRLSGLA